jgi:hypothetical protein
MRTATVRQRRIAAAKTQLQLDKLRLAAKTRLGYTTAAKTQSQLGKAILQQLLKKNRGTMPR